jgi:hypothetical protein
MSTTMRTTICVSLTIIACLLFMANICVFITFMCKCGDDTACGFYIPRNLRPMIVVNSIIALYAMIHYLVVVGCILIKQNYSFLLGASIFMAIFTFQYSLWMAFMFNYGYIIIYIGVVCKAFQLALPYVIRPQEA